jgi:CheY-like chemotaxis protein
MRPAQAPVKPDDRPSQVLVVDNSAAMRRNLTMILTSLNLQVTEAGDGWEALALALERPFNLVITDLNMTPGDGFELITSLGLLPPERRPKVIVCSALVGADSTQAREVLGGVAALIAKPIELNALLSAVKAALEVS